MPIRCRGLSRLLILELALLTALPWLTLDVHAAETEEVEVRASRMGQSLANLAGAARAEGHDCRLRRHKHVRAQLTRGE